MANRTTTLRVWTLICAVALCWPYPADAWLGKKKAKPKKTEQAQPPTPMAEGMRLAWEMKWDEAIAKLREVTEPKTVGGAGKMHPRSPGTPSL